MRAGGLLVLLALLPSPNPAGPAIAYFSNVRAVQVNQSDRQNYFIVDAEVWAHARADLGDLRLYDGESPVQYRLSEQRESTSSEEVEARILNLGRVAGHTEFDFDAESLANYDRIRLRLDAKDFVVTASVSGSNSLRSGATTELPPSTLYDFSSEHLGSNSVLKLPPSSFHYLHVKLSGGILPRQIKGASIFNLREEQASWIKFGSCGRPRQKQTSTEIVCEVPPKVPLDRIEFQVASDQVNFSRSVSVLDTNGNQETRGEISRVRVDRAGSLVSREALTIAVADRSGRFTVSVENGDNPALAIMGVQPLSLERRIYFDPHGKTSLKLYYGDEKLMTPVYDYARFFHLEPAAVEAQLGPGEHNPRYTGHADDRPWSERHMGILWAAMIVAVVGLTLLAVRGLRRDVAR